MNDYPKTIFIHAKEWRDKVNGNSYFSARIYLDGELATIIPFQYGYDRQFYYESIRVLVANGKLPKDTNNYYHLLKQNYGIILHAVIERNQLQRDVKNWGRS